MKTRQPVIRPIFLSLLMALPIGFGIVLLADLGVQESWWEVRREVLDVEYPGSVSSSRELGFLRDGTPVIKYSHSGKGRDQRRTLQLDGTPFPIDAELGTLAERKLRNDPFIHHPWIRTTIFEGLLPRQIKSSFSDPLNSLNRWYWQTDRNDDRRFMLMAVPHLSEARPVFNYCSASGFSDRAPDLNDYFIDAGDYRSYDDHIVLRSGDKLIDVNLRERTVSTICRVKPRSAWGLVHRNKEELLFAVCDGDKLNIYNEQSEIVFEHSVPYTRYGPPHLCTIPDGGFIVIRHLKTEAEVLPYDCAEKRVTVVAEWIDDAGKVNRTHEFENSHRLEVALPRSNTVYFIDQFMEQAGPGFAMPSPAVICTALLAFQPYLHSLHSPDIDFSLAVEISLARMPYAIPVTVAISLLCTIACWRQQHRLGIPWTKTWVVFIFLFGLPAWIAWRVHRRWPPLDLAGGPEAEFVGPEPNGLEIR